MRRNTSAVLAAAPPWLRLARVAWLLLALLTLAVISAGIPAWYQQATTTTTTLPNEESLATPIDVVQVVRQHAFPLNTLIDTVIAAKLLLALPYFVIAGLLFWRKPGEPVGLLAAFLLLVAGANRLWEAQVALAYSQPALRVPVFVLNSAGIPALAWTLFFFPDGHAVPRWAKWPAIGLGAFIGLWDVAFLTWGGPFGGLLTVLLLLAGFVAQIYRYWRISGPLQQQQTKWVLAGLLVAVAIASVNLPDPFTPGQPLWLLWVYLVGQLTLGMWFFAVGIGISVLRFRLWDIDLLTRRTLIYGTLTALLALTYFGGVLVLQNLFSALTGERQSALATVLSTLAIAALFVPLRGQVQAVIDRRFYRRKYDTARTLAAFGATLRDETNLDQLQVYLSNVVAETMLPATVALWLRPTRSSAPASPAALADDQPR